MTRADLINSLIARYRDIPPSQIDKSVREIFEQMIETLSQGERVEIRGFGSFEVRLREPRIAHNPKTGERVDLPARKVVHFKPGVELRNRVNS